MKPDSRERPRPSWGRRLLALASALGLLYLLLLLPEREAIIPREPRREAFAWNQNSYWSELERQFTAARREGCPALTGRVDGLAGEVRRHLDEMAGKSLVPDDTAFLALETNFFQLGSLIAACPQRLPDYLQLAARVRTEVKRQSHSWNMNSGPARQRLYRLLFGARMALEEVMLQAPPGIEVPALMLGEEEASRTPAVTVLGVTVRSGDILLSRGGAPTSSLIARGNDFPGSFSHVALVHVDEQTGRLSVIESHIECGVAVASFAEYVLDQKLRVLLLRLRADLPALVADPMLPHRAASRALAEAGRRHIPYDFAMDHRDHQAQFCSEVASAAYEPFGIQLWMGLSTISAPTVRAWLGSLGVRHFETQEPSDLEYDPQLRVVAEWRDRGTLFKAHADDAVTDVMLEEAEPGRGLSYPRSRLPLARLGKAYSVALNAFGKVGPVPEGMSAATALRVSRYRQEHAAMTARLSVLAREFERRQGYCPPYWELVRLARQARGEVLGMP